MAKNAVVEGLSLKTMKPTIVAVTGSIDAIIDAFDGESLVSP